ncbi:TIGR04290 family methyltransferase [Rubellimicrobium aerolatum]|uniref:TIGR04290 family methyltransferase n=1 Tax=Rubellimicrobium aerolatum TaxID=490979 RepID=A0ABW0S9J1_9RHOB|nr:TIGR04290 family methyltransferase [Rubellimicrobium aerolatum]MBP1804915.1 tRNA (mo5U34)-methyltransferase [Rubellimicrobium aerolatum]
MKDVSDPGEDDLARRIEALGPWFHNLRLGGIETAPGHFLGDFPRTKFERFDHAVPADLSGKSVLDIGCNAGFYSLEMKRRGAARVLGIDHDEHYLRQARLAAEVEGMDIEFRRLEVYDVGALGESFDVVIFMGVLYHLRHPLLALDLIREHVAGDLLIFQSLLRGTEEVLEVPEEMPFSEEAVFERVGYPALYFIEKSYSEDWTNWWAPNRAGVEAMLRAAGFAIETRASEDVYICRRAEVPYSQWGAGAAYPARGAAR